MKDPNDPNDDAPESNDSDGGDYGTTHSDDWGDTENKGDDDE